MKNLRICTYAKNWIKQEKNPCSTLANFFKAAILSKPEIQDSITTQSVTNNTLISYDVGFASCNMSRFGGWHFFVLLCLTYPNMHNAYCCKRFALLFLCLLYNNFWYFVLDFNILLYLKKIKIQNLFKTYLQTFSILEILSSILAVFSKLQASSFMNQKTYNWMNILSDDSGSAPLGRKWYSL